MPMSRILVSTTIRDTTASPSLHSHSLNLGIPTEMPHLSALSELLLKFIAQHPLDQREYHGRRDLELVRVAGVVRAESQAVEHGA